MNPAHEKKLPEANSITGYACRLLACSTMTFHAACWHDEELKYVVWVPLLRFVSGNVFCRRFVCGWQLARHVLMLLRLLT